MIDRLRHGRVLVHNWHKLDWQADEEIAKRRSVDKRGAKSDEAYARDVLGEMASARDLIAINDEAHHAWRRIVLTLNMTKIVHHIGEAIRCENTQRLEPVFDSQRPILSTTNMRPWYTGRPCDPTRRSHISLCVYGSTHEKNAAIELDREKQKNVAAWVKNDNLEFEILYVFQGVVRKYRPDFLIRLTNGTTLILEIKGEDTEESQVKRRFLEEWVRTVNAHGGFGRWAADFSLNPKDVGELLKKHNRLRLSPAAQRS